MDILAHGFYGATICSRSGLAGGRSRRMWLTDWTVWAAALFGILPDVASMGLPFLHFWRAGLPGNFFRGIDPGTLVQYHYWHSLVISLPAAALLRVIWKPLFVPSLAWTLHVLMDAVTHGTGKFQGMLFYPMSEWATPGISWWQHPEIVAAYWFALPLIWAGLFVWRRDKIRAGR